MTTEDELSHTISHLRATLGSDGLAEGQKERGTALLQRLLSPVRMTLLGLPGSGKTELVNMLAGEKLMPAIPDMPTTELVFGDEPGCHVVFADGTKVSMGWPADEGFEWADAVFVKVSYPLPILKEISLLEIVTDGSAQDLSNALNWAIPRSDMAIWCTQEFNRLENALWVQVPDALKDHSNLVVTKADELGVSGKLADILKRLNPIVDEEFQQLYAVATTHYLGALGGDGQASADARKLTGAGAILDAVMGDVRRGRQADLDGAEVFLARYGVDEIPEPTVDEQPEEPIQATSVSPNTAIKIEGEEAAPDAAWIDTAVSIVREQGGALSEIADREDDIAEDVLATCVDTVDRLVELAADSGVSGTPLVDEIEEAYEMVVLMQLEQAESAAADAATVILQLSRELEMAKAA